MSTNDPIPYATEQRRRVPGWWSGLVSVGIAVFGAVWIAFGWTAVIRGTDGANVMLGMLCSATAPGAMVGLFLGIVAIQRRRGAWGAAGVTLNAVNLLAGPVAFVGLMLLR